MGSTEQQMCPFWRGEEIEGKETRVDYRHNLNSSSKSLFEAQQLIFSGGGDAAAYRFSYAFRIPLCHFGSN